MPLYEKIGGEMVVLSHEAAAKARRWQVPVKVLDDLPGAYLTFGRGDVARTVAYLEERRGAVVYFECFDMMQYLEKSRQFVLFHGNGLKDWLNEWRVRMINRCDYVAALGPNNREKLLRGGVEEKRLAPVGVLRWDRIIAGAHDRGLKARICERAGGQGPVVTYIPTWFGPTSVRYTGLKMAEAIDSRYIMVVKPHPQTPKEILDRYREMAARKGRIIFFDDEDVDIVALYEASDLIIGDASSVMVDSFLADKPLIFALDASMKKFEPSADPAERAVRFLKVLFGVGNRPFRRLGRLYRPIREMFDYCEKVDTFSAGNINDVIARTLDRGIDEEAWRAGKERMFYSLGGDAAETVAADIRKVLGDMA
jgi:CDP-glycerol glycerophosphotransferase (TagB/SpsB family)